MLMETELLDMDRVSDIEKMTGTESTLGKALDDIYPREDAVERNTNRLDGVEIPNARQDALHDFGRAAVVP